MWRIISLLMLTFTLGLLFFIADTPPPLETIPNYSPELCTVSTKTPRTSFLGLAVLSIEEPEARQLIEEIGVDFIRVEFRWDRIEPNPGEYNWQYVDEIVSYMTDKELDILATINHPPVWSHDIEKFSEHFDSFLRIFVQRYDEQIDYYEIFNEPNLAGYGWPFKTKSIEHDAHFYASVLTNANITIRSIHPDAFIIFGGLSPSGWNPLEYLELVYRYSHSHCFDILSYHPYGQIDRLVALQTELESFISSLGADNKTVWFAEFGTSDEDIAVETIRKLEQQLPELNGVIWFSLRDLKPWGWNFGLVEYNWDKKPAFAEFEGIFQE